MLTIINAVKLFIIIIEPRSKEEKKYLNNIFGDFTLLGDVPGDRNYPFKCFFHSFRSILSCFIVYLSAQN